MARLFSVLNVLSVLMVIFAIALLAPLTLSYFYGDAAQLAFGATAGLLAVCGVLLWLATRRSRIELQPHDGFLLVALAWTALPAFAALPLLWHLEGLGFTRAFFEAVAGLTDTAASALVETDALPPSINFWRCELQWLGGLGIIILAIAILPLLGVGGSQIRRAETPGPMKDTRLTPRITETAKGLSLVYAGLTAACALVLRAAGMGWFDAVTHAFAIVGLGGFSPYQAGFARFDSPALEAAAAVFMALSAINFGTHFLALRRRALTPYRGDPELGAFLGMLALSVAGIALFLWVKGVYASFWTALRYSAFNVVSMATTAGFATANFGDWPVFAPLWMLFLCCFASCSGSTGGGIKMLRAQIMVRQALRELQRIIHPRAFIPMKLAGQVIENNIIFAVLAFMLIYGGAIIAIGMLLALTGLDAVSAFSAAIACINNTGPGMGRIAPGEGYAGLTDAQLWICAAGMLLGRLELITLLVVVTPSFWRR